MDDNRISHVACFDTSPPLDRRRGARQREMKAHTSPDIMLEVQHTHTCFHHPRVSLHIYQLYFISLSSFSVSSVVL